MQECEFVGDVPAALRRDVCAVQAGYCRTDARPQGGRAVGREVAGGGFACGFALEPEAGVGEEGERFGYGEAGQVEALLPQGALDVVAVFVHAFDALFAKQGLQRLSGARDGVGDERAAARFVAQ